MQTRRSLIAGGLAAPMLGAWRTSADPFKLMSEEGRYLPLAARLRADVEGKTGPALLGAAQSLAQHLARMGDEAGALAAWDLAFPNTRPGPDMDLTGATARDALEEIVEASRGRRIVILNEAHHVSHNRRFAERVAVALAAEGFNVFAAEAFQQGWPPAKSGPVTSADGLYLLDPVYAELLRVVRGAGYRLAAYEQRDDQEAPDNATPAERTAAREEAQADNLIALALRDPKARVLVYCGFGHLIESPSPRGERMFAARLKAKTGADPLTIEQARGKPVLDPEKDDPVVRAVSTKFGSYQSLVVRQADGTMVTTAGAGWMAADLEVFHPREPDMNGRPAWTSRDGRRLYLMLDWTKLPPGDQRLLQAIPEAELKLSKAAVPADQYPLRPAARHGALYLRPGRYVVRVETPTGLHRIGAVTI